MFDSSLEALIDYAGRDRVFARAQALGWSLENTPPRWVWIAIANDLVAESGLHAPKVTLCPPEEAANG